MVALGSETGPAFAWGISRWPEWGNMGHPVARGVLAAQRRFRRRCAV